MKIGIIVYSQTGNTYEAAENIKEALSSKGHSVDIERVEVDDEKERDINKIKIDNFPDLTQYEGVIFGSPVHAFSLSQPMSAYMSQITSLKDKKLACFVTKSLPFNITGGNQAVSKMKKIAESKGGSIYESAIIVWTKDRENQISKATEKLSRTF